MGSSSAIEWTDATWNPTRGCSRISPGCKNCYAETFAARFAHEARDGKKAGPYFGFVLNGHWTGRVALMSDRLVEPMKWQAPRRIFVDSMSDLFHEDLPDRSIDQVLAVMLMTPRHTFQVLTKRADRMCRYFAAPDLYKRVLIFVDVLRAANDELYSVGVSDPGWSLPAHIWLGVSVESQDYIDRVADLVRTPARVRFLSLEPLLGPVDLERARPRDVAEDTTANLLTGALTGPALNMRTQELEPVATSEPNPRAAVQWVIAGGESGQDARPMDRDWARSIRDQCARAGVPFFFKQWGAWMPSEGMSGRIAKRTRMVGATLMEHAGKVGAGRELDGRTHDAFPGVA